MEQPQQFQDDDMALATGWRRFWPILIGLILAMALALGGFLAGQRFASPGETPSSAAIASANISSVASASALPVSIAAASAPLGFAGSFDAYKALQVIFGEMVQKGSERYARWVHPQFPAQASFQLLQGRGALRMTPLFATPVNEYNELRQALIFQGAPETEDYGAVYEPASIGIAIFRDAGGRWELVRENRTLLAAGAFGQAPKGRAVALGPQNWGLLFQGSFEQEGINRTQGWLVSTEGEQFVPLTETFDLGSNNAGDCKDDAQRCFRTNGELRFGPAVVNGRFAIQHVLKGSRINSEQHLEDFVETRQLVYQGGIYVEDPQQHQLKIKPRPVLSSNTASSAASASSPE